MAWPFHRRDRDLDDEIRAHLAMTERDRIDRGETPDEARTRARREFGNVDLVKQVTRDVSPWRHVDRVGQDLRISLRRLRARPATTAVAVGMLGLAIGITTAMFTLVDAFLLRPMPFHDADRLARVWMRNKGGGPSFVAPSVLRAWRASGVFDAAEGVTTEEIVLDAAAGPVVRVSAFVSPGLFDMLGVRPLHGRLFDVTDGSSETRDHALISEDLWRGVFNGDRGIIGSRVAVGQETVLVVGVLPAQFRFPEWNTQLWRPIDYDVQPPGPPRFPVVYVRIKADIPEVDALRVATSAAHSADASTTQRWAAPSRPADEAFAFGARYMSTGVPLLAGGVSLVFLVLCANVGSVLLTRFNARRREFGMCSALGASRARLLWQASVESGLLGAMGVIAGVGLAWWLVSAVRGVLPITFLSRSLNPVDLDGRALLVAATLGVVATLIAGVLPAWLGTRSLEGVAKADRTTTEPRGARALTRAFLITQVALACALLVSAALLVRSFVSLSRVGLGFDPTGIVALRVEPNRALVPDRTAQTLALDRAAAELASLPGVRRVVQSQGVPLFDAAGMHWGDWQADDSGARSTPVQVESYRVGPGWFEMYGLRLVRGRDFAAGEESNHVILGRQLASSLWPTSDPIGRSFHWDKGRYQVVGVVDDLRSPVKDLEGDYSEIYLPFGGSAIASTLGLRCDDACPSEGLVRQRLLTAVPMVDVYRFGGLGDIYHEELAQPRAMATLGLVFGSLALPVAASGLFSVLSHAVGRRRREFGIRLALGSTPGQIRRLVVRDGLGVAVAGIGLGSIAASLLARTLSSVLYGVTSSDPLTWSAVLIVLLLAIVAGSWRPARQATRVDPVSLLREE